MSEPAGPESAGDRAYRRRFRDRGNKRDDYAVDLFREALVSLGDRPRLERILFELGRLYNPLVNGPIMDGSSRRQIVAHLEVGRVAEARTLLEGRLEEYVRAAEVEPVDRPSEYP